VMRNRQARLIPLIAGLACLGAAVPAAGTAAEPWGFEQVSPPNKGGGTVSASDTFQSSLDGDSFLYTANAPFAGVSTEASPQYVRYLATRGPDAWSNRGIDPPHGVTGVNVMMVVGTSVDLSHALVATTRALVPDATEGGGSLYMRDTRTGGLTLVATSPNPQLAGSFTTSQGAMGVSYIARDGRSALFTSSVPLCSGCPDNGITGAPGYYKWTATDGVELVSVLPDSEGGGGVGTFTTAGGSEYGVRDSRPFDDGLDHVYFSAPLGGDQGPVYVRTGDQTETVSVSRLDGLAKPGLIDAVSNGGRYVLFHTRNNDRLLDHPLPPSGTGEMLSVLYRYDVMADPEEALTFIGTTDQQGSSVLQMTQDGQTVVFRSTEELADGAVAGQPNFYLWREGALRHVVTVDSGSSGTEVGQFLRRLSTDGRYFAFTDNSVSLAQRFGQDNVSSACTDVNRTERPCDMVYVYDADANGGEGELTCASCVAGGKRPRGHAGDTALPTGFIRMNAHQARTVADDGTVFFTSSDGLVAGDSNGLPDAYAYRDGQLRLLSRGAQGVGSRFLDATPDGKTVFFSTDDAIVGTDTDRAVDVYVTREGAGYPFTAPVVVPPCSGVECRAPFAQAGGSGLLVGSLAFDGAGNVPTAKPPGKVRVSGLRAVSGSAGTLRVRVPGRGRVVTSGRGLRRSSVAAKGAGTVKVAVRLSKTARRTLAKGGPVRLRATVRFVPASGRSQSARVQLTFKARAAKSRRRASAGGR
jgi:hypothetical protein